MDMQGLRRAGQGGLAHCAWRCDDFNIWQGRLAGQALRWFTSVHCMLLPQACAVCGSRTASLMLAVAGHTTTLCTLLVN